MAWACCICNFFLLFTVVGGAFKMLNCFYCKLLLAAPYICEGEWSKRRPVTMPEGLVQRLLTWWPEVNVFLLRDQEEELVKTC